MEQPHHEDDTQIDAMNYTPENRKNREQTGHEATNPEKEDTHWSQPTRTVQEMKSHTLAPSEAQEETQED
eukprot:8851113-Prorocentrum_lima.AAC.1